MSEYLLKQEHLQDYTGILTSHNKNGNFKMALKVEDNPVLKKSIENIESNIELEFYYNIGLSTLFFYDIHSCPNRNGNCPECEDIKKKHHKFEANLDRLQIGDTFRIQAALVNNKQSELPVKIHFKAYESIIVACTEYRLRLDDTPEGIKKKVEIEEQRLQREQDKKANEEQARKDARRRKRKESFQQFFGKHPNLNQIIVSAIGGVIAGIILTTIVNPIPRLFRYIYIIFFFQIRNSLKIAHINRKTQRGILQ